MSETLPTPDRSSVEGDSWGDIARLAGRSLASTLLFWAVWGAIALVGVWIATNTSDEFEEMSRVSWLGLTFFATGLGGLVGYFSLVSVTQVLAGETKALRLSPFQYLRAMACFVAWGFAVYFLYRAVVG